MRPAVTSFGQSVSFSVHLSVAHVGNPTKTDELIELPFGC